MSRLLNSIESAPTDRKQRMVNWINNTKQCEFCAEELGNSIKNDTPIRQICHSCGGSGRLEVPDER